MGAKKVILAIIAISIVVGVVSNILPSGPGDNHPEIKDPSTGLIAYYGSNYVRDHLESGLAEEYPGKNMDYQQKYSLGYLDGGNAEDGWTAHGQVGSYILNNDSHRALFIYYELYYKITVDENDNTKYDFEITDTAIDNWESNAVQLDWETEAIRLFNVFYASAGKSNVTYDLDVFDYPWPEGGITHSVIGDAMFSGITQEVYISIGYIDGEFLVAEMRIDGDIVVRSNETFLLLCSDGQW